MIAGNPPAHGAGNYESGPPAGKASRRKIYGAGVVAAVAALTVMAVVAARRRKA